MSGFGLTSFQWRLGLAAGRSPASRGWTRRADADLDRRRAGVLIGVDVEQVLQRVEAVGVHQRALDEVRRGVALIGEHLV